MIRILNIVSFLLVIGLSVLIYDVKYRIQEQEAEITRIEREIRAEEDAIRVLRAEYSYLTQAERLQQLAERHLGLAPLHASQIATFDELPLPPHGDEFYGPGSRQVLNGYAGSIPSAGVQ